MKRSIPWMPTCALVAFALVGCDNGTAPSAPSSLSTSTGPQVVWDLGASPLPNIPLPNDIATVRDDTSPTGLRLNASLMAPTGLESQFRAEFDELDGWGTYEAITIPFTADLDIGNIVRRHQGDDFDFTDDAVYVVDLTSGMPMPLDFGSGAFQYIRKNQGPLFPNDPRAGQSNILYETVNEDVNHDGIYRAALDTNFDGILGVPNVYPVGGDTFEDLMGFYEYSTHTLIGRPVLPLLENHRYAMVVTDRLVGTDGQPVRSPFPTVAHPDQASDLAVLATHLTVHPEVYGTLRYGQATNDPAGASHVVFAGRFTTQTTVSEWFAVRRGLYGQGPLAQIETDPTVTITNVAMDSGACSATDAQEPFRAHMDQIQSVLEAEWQLGGGPSMQVQQAEIQSFSNTAYMVMGTYRSPFLMASDPSSIDPQAHWQINASTGTVQHMGTATIPFMLFVPRADATHRQPFPLAYYMHGYGSGITEVMVAAGTLNQNGIAVIAIDGPTHGLPVTDGLISALTTLARGECIVGIGQTLLNNDRARDLNGDGLVDTAGDFWTGYVVHARDNVREYGLEISQLVRAVRGWDGTAHSPQDLNNDTHTGDDIAGDFDGDGVPDVGGTAPFYALGESLGGIMADWMGAAESEFHASTPFSGGGGLSDVAVRSSQGGIDEAVHLRLMGPLIVGVPASQRGPVSGASCTSDYDCNQSDRCRMMAGIGQCFGTRTACTPNQISIRMVAPNVTSVGELEIGCADLGIAQTSTAANTVAAVFPGDDVLVVNVTNGQVRCGAVDSMGQFRVGIPADVNDNVSVQVFQGQVVSDYGTCHYDSATAQLRPGPGGLRQAINAYAVIEGDCNETCGHVPVGGLHACASGQVSGCDMNLPNTMTPYQPTYFRVQQRGQPLTAWAEGLGLRRQSPEYRRFFNLAQAGLDKGDPINFAPYYFLEAPPSPEPAPSRHGLISVSTIGDQNVPLNTGNAFARAAGLIPFLRPERIPPSTLRDYVSPAAITALWNQTPNQVLISDFVLEGISWLDHWPVPRDPGALLSTDALDEGQAGFGEIELVPHMRLGRLARAITDASGDATVVWTPRTQSMWTPDATQPLAAALNYDVEPDGHHSVDNPPRPDLPWDYTTYMYNLVGQFFATDASDVYYLSHPSTHRCLENSTCPDTANHP